LLVQLASLVQDKPTAQFEVHIATAWVSVFAVLPASLPVALKLESPL
jgi:hypothetical protein